MEEEINKELKAEIESLIFDMNTMSENDFLGLSADQMHTLIYEPYAEQSLLKLKNVISDEALSQCPFFIISECFLKIIEREKALKLTPKMGNLPQKVVGELYGKKYILDDSIEMGIFKNPTEDNLPHIKALHYNCLEAGLIKKTAGKISLTKRGSLLISNLSKRQELFELILKTFTQKYNWAYTDYYEFEDLAQTGFGFSLMLLQKFGHEPQSISFYANKYLSAFPLSIHRQTPFFNFQLESNDKSVTAINCFRNRMADHFLLWFGLIEMPIRLKYPNENDSLIQPSTFFHSIFQKVII
jgi:hypothetical protein